MIIFCLTYKKVVRLDFSNQRVKKGLKVSRLHKLTEQKRLNQRCKIVLIVGRIILIIAENI